MPIKSMIALFFPQREHTAIMEQEKSLFPMAPGNTESTIQLNWVTTLTTE